MEIENKKKDQKQKDLIESLTKENKPKRLVYNKRI
jgi:hypothetical protein